MVGSVVGRDGGRRAPYVVWMTTTAGQAEETGAQAKAAAAAYEAAFVMTVPPPVIAANRALLMALIATNFFGQNTPAIMATEADYVEMWAQDAAAMYGVSGHGAGCVGAEPVYRAGADHQSGGAGWAGRGGRPSCQHLCGYSCADRGTVYHSNVHPLSFAMSTPLTTVATPDALAELASIASSMSSSSSASPLSLLPTVTSSSTAFTSGISWPDWLGYVDVDSGPLGDRFGGFARRIAWPEIRRPRQPNPDVGIDTGRRFTRGTAFGSGVGSAQVTAGMGRAASLGTLSVPQSWAAAAPAFSHVGSALPGAGVSATPAVSPGEPEACSTGCRCCPKSHAARAPLPHTRPGSASVPPWCNPRYTPDRDIGP